ncbi:Regulatory protein RecX [Magnetospirillum sp. LM-5]|uniref:regulatory protein RecX n=1 Tax=Magnetospirillum sp. LM-5 TaxID=2681466 RepID=UPI00138321DD|nr:regulatory protein RecX [Magnetospirillum sp. LM-5]CAA7624754.1 Regulatory protein RecX [Magnetospirillum sp. LM-5]
MAKTSVPPRITPSYLENAALHYLERFASSTASLRRVLKRKVVRSVAHWGDDADQALAHIEAVIAKLTQLGYLNDSAYAELKTGALHRRGKGARAIRASLAAKGVGAADSEQALAALAEDHAQPDRAAAITLARRRRLGPFRAAGRAENRARDLAVMGRNGFDFETARAIIDAASPETLTEEDQ